VGAFLGMNIRFSQTLIQMDSLLKCNRYVQKLCMRAGFVLAVAC
jgi:hypothetical protein